MTIIMKRVVKKRLPSSVKAKGKVQFAFIPRSVIAQILYKNSAERLKSFQVPNNNSSN